MGKHQYQLQHF